MIWNCGYAKVASGFQPEPVRVALNMLRNVSSQATSNPRLSRQDAGDHFEGACPVIWNCGYAKVASGFQPEPVRVALNML